MSLASEARKADDIKEIRGWLLAGAEEMFIKDTNFPLHRKNMFKRSIVKYCDYNQ